MRQNSDFGQVIGELLGKYSKNHPFLYLLTTLFLIGFLFHLIEKYYYFNYKTDYELKKMSQEEILASIKKVKILVLILTLATSLIVWLLNNYA